MVLLLLAACPAPDTSTDDATTGLEDDPDTDTAGDTDTAEEDTAEEDTADEGARYHRGNAATLDDGRHFDCIGFSAFTVGDDGQVEGNAEAHCSLPDDPDTFHHLQGPIAGSQTAGVLAATWSITLCAVETEIALAGTVTQASVDATYGADVPCTLAGTMAAPAD